MQCIILVFPNTAFFLKKKCQISDPYYKLTYFVMLAQQNYKKEEKMKKRKLQQN